MLAVVGTIPEADFPLAAGPVEMGDQGLRLDGRVIEVTRGTAALLAAAGACLETLRQPAPFAFLAGDTGLGHGSERLYEHLAGHLGETAFTAITFHYILPVVDWHQRVFFALEEMRPRPCLIADAGFMYVAKMSGLAPAYDLFTPDAGEMAFLADEEAPHPFYTRGFILHEDSRVPDLIRRAYAHGNAARYLLVKGSVDYLADRSGILATVQEPDVEALEPIGGTGDTLTGIVSALIASGWDIAEAAVLAARINRRAGELARPTPATSVADIIRRIPGALNEIYAPDAGHDFESSLLR
ncbi:MAG: sugar kinase [Deltaproteobacteria bacterium]|nr:sugar kinase [Deltaproteobacteria bacterium]